ELDPKETAGPIEAARTERLLALEANLGNVRQGKFKPQDDAEQLAMAELCQYHELYAAAARLFADVLGPRPDSANPLTTPPITFRFAAAGCAALAGSGTGTDAGQLDDKEKARLRKHALDWMRDDLAVRRKQIESGTAHDLGEARRLLRISQQVIDLAGI